MATVGLRGAWPPMLGRFAAAWLLAGVAAASPILEFDYSKDTGGFFAAPERRATLSLAGNLVNRFLDDLAPIVPSGTNTWSYWLTRPDNLVYEFPQNETIPTNVIRIFPGGSSLSDSGPLAITYSAIPWQLAGDEAWKATVRTRGQPGAAGTGATDYGPFAGSLVFNASKAWSSGTAAPAAGTYDLLSIAAHELLHLFGFGVSQSFKNLVVSGSFVGPHALAAAGPSNPHLLLAGQSHWAAGTTGTIAGLSATAIMNETFAAGERRLPTDLDRAALQDIGWRPAAIGDVDRDGAVTPDDLLVIGASGAFTAGGIHGWNEGDVNGDGLVNPDDLLAISATGLFNGGPYALAATSPVLVVPEPDGVFPGLVSLATWFCARYLRQGRVGTSRRSWRRSRWASARVGIRSAGLRSSNSWS